MKKVLVVALIALLPACSPVMEANRPDPVDMSQFVVGEKRLDIIAEIGSPKASVKDGDNSCDIYKLYTTGPGAVGKGAIAAGEIVADVFTLGLAEVVFTPTEAATSADRHTVIVCYSPDNKMVSMKTSETAASE